MDNRIPKGVLVFIEGEGSRDFVGLLSRSGEELSFQYDSEYLKKDYALSLGPELPLRKAKYLLGERELSAFVDRLPSKRNIAYKSYCKAVGISPDEEDLFTLLSTLGRRGPSSFVFEGWFPAQ